MYFIMILMKGAIAKPRTVGRPLSFDRVAVLEKAMLTFWRHGYETTSISDLTKAMGVTAPSVYTAFGDKKRLFLEAMHRYAGSPEDLDQTLRTSATAYEAVYRMLMSAADAFTNGDTPRGCLLASATASGSAASMDVQEAVARVRRQITDRVRTRIEQDIAAGILPADTQAAALAALAIALIQGLSVLARDGEPGDALKKIVESAMAAWPESILGREPLT
jgi:AcrR family transcriptional regulator